MFEESPVQENERENINPFRESLREILSQPNMNNSLQQIDIVTQLQTLSPSIVASNIIGAIQEGEIDALDIMVFLDSLKRVHDEVRKGIEDNVVTELMKHGGKANINGAKVTTADTGIKYDYSVDAIWCHLDATAQIATERRKEREGLLKNVKSQTIFVDPLTGETYELSGIPKTSKTSFKIETNK